MTARTRAEVRNFLLEQLSEQLEAQGRTIGPEYVSDDRDLLLSGLIDSLGLLELAAALSEFCGFELDFDKLDPEEITIVGPLCDFVAQQAAARSG